MLHCSGCSWPARLASYENAGFQRGFLFLRAEIADHTRSVRLAPSSNFSQSRSEARLTGLRCWFDVQTELRLQSRGTSCGWRCDEEPATIASTCASPALSFANCAPGTSWANWYTMHVYLGRSRYLGRSPGEQSYIRRSVASNCPWGSWRVLCEL